MKVPKISENLFLAILRSVIEIPKRNSSYDWISRIQYRSFYENLYVKSDRSVGIEQHYGNNSKTRGITSNLKWTTVVVVWVHLIVNVTIFLFGSFCYILPSKRLIHIFNKYGCDTKSLVFHIYFLFGLTAQIINSVHMQTPN